LSSTITVAFEPENVDLSDEDALKEALGEFAERIRGAATEVTPGDEFPNTIQMAEVEGGFLVYTEDYKAWWIEFGTGQRETQNGANRGEMPTFAPFRRGIEAAGA